MAGRNTKAPLWRRIFSLPNLLAAAIAVLVFAIGVVLFDSNRGALVAAAVASLAGGGVWLTLWFLDRSMDLETALRGAPNLGAIPDVPGTPAPTLVDPASTPAGSYRDVYASLEAHTNGQVVMVTSAAPGQGSTTVAMNLAISASQAGRRVLLIDGDVDGRGLSRYLGSGPEPGLTDLASGDAILRDAARMWRVDDQTAFPVVPSGSPRDDAPSLLGGTGVADMIDRVTERADLVLIDAPPILWNGTSGPLARHADGSMLVVNETTPAEAAAAARDQLVGAGAPLLGYVVNRFDGTRLTPRPWGRFAGRVLTLFFLLLLGFGLYTGGRLYASWQGLQRETLATDEARGTIVALPEINVDEGEQVEDPAISAADLEDNTTAIAAFDGPYRSFLLIGGDEAAGAADVILLAVLPTDAGSPFMVSLPRDLYLPNNCTGGFTRINATIHGCDSINGETNLALTIEEFTGISVDHFAKFDFSGFAEVIDGVGGVEICLEYPVRDWRAQLDMPAGCTNATGEQALSWVRSRHTEQLVNGGWRSMPGAGDLLRNQHQQDVLLELFKKLKSLQSPNDLAAKVNSLATAFVLDDQLGLADAIGLGWTVRDLELEEILQIQLPVRLTKNAKGQSILIATQPFDEVLREANPDFAAAIYGDPPEETAAPEG